MLNDDSLKSLVPITKPSVSSNLLCSKLAKKKLNIGLNNVNSSSSSNSSTNNSNNKAIFKLTSQKKQKHIMPTDLNLSYYSSNRKRNRKTKIRGIFGMPGVGLQRPFYDSQSVMNKTNDEDLPSGFDNKIAIVSSDNRFFLSQDVCVLCGTLGIDEEGSLISCTQCGQCYHFYCVGVKLTAILLERSWRCLDCTVCEGCGQRNDDAKLILCDDCDISYHIYCMDPPLEYVPRGNWKCKWCAICQTCGSKYAGVNSNWVNSYSQCGPCASQEMCPVCSESYLENDLIIQCYYCSRWLHANCDSIKSKFEAEQCAIHNYVCILCRPRDTLPPHRLIANQNLAINPNTDDLQQKFINSSSYDTQLLIDGVSLTEHGGKEIRSILTEAHQPNSIRKKRKKSLLEKNNILSSNETVAASTITSLASDCLSDLFENNKHDNYKDGMVWSTKINGSTPPDGFIFQTNDNGVTVLRKKRQRNLQRLGIGGFSVRLRATSNTSTKGDNADIPLNLVESVTNEDFQRINSGKRKCQRNRKPKNKLAEAYPTYLQDAFFGRDLLEGKNNSNLDDDQLSIRNRSSDRTQVFSGSNTPSLENNSPVIKDELQEILHNQFNMDSIPNMDGNDVDEIFKGVLTAPSAEKSASNTFSGTSVSASSPNSTKNNFNSESFPDVFNQSSSSSSSPSLLMTNNSSILNHRLLIQQQQQQQQQPSQSQQSPQQTSPTTPLPHSAPLLHQSQQPQQPQQQSIQSPLSFPSQSPYQSEYSNSPQFSPAFSEPTSPWVVSNVNMNGTNTSNVENADLMDSNSNGSAQFSNSSLLLTSATKNPSLTPSSMVTQITPSYSQRSTEKMKVDETLGDGATISAVLYANKNFPQLKIEYPTWNDRCKQILKKWRALSSGKKQPYLQKARDNRSALRMKKAQQLQQTSMSTTATTSATTMPSSTNIMAKSNTTIGITAMVNVDNEDTLLTSSEAKSQQSPSVNEVCNTLAFTNNQSNEDKMSQTNLVISNTTNLNHKDHTNHDNTKLYPKLYEKLTNTTTSNTNLTKSPSPPPIRVLTPSEIMQTLPPSLCRNEVPTQPNLKNTDTDSTIASVVVEQEKTVQQKSSKEIEQERQWKQLQAIRQQQTQQQASQMMIRAPVNMEGIQSQQHAIASMSPSSSSSSHTILRLSSPRSSTISYQNQPLPNLVPSSSQSVMRIGDPRQGDQTNSPSTPSQPIMFNSQGQAINQDMITQQQLAANFSDSSQQQQQPPPPPPLVHNRNVDNNTLLAENKQLRELLQRQQLKKLENQQKLVMVGPSNNQQKSQQMVMTSPTHQHQQMVFLNSPNHQQTTLSPNKNVWQESSQPNMEQSAEFQFQKQANDLSNNGSATNIAFRSPLPPNLSKIHKVPQAKKVVENEEGADASHDIEKFENPGSNSAPVSNNSGEDSIDDLLGGLADDDDELLAEMGSDFNILQYADPELNNLSGAEKSSLLEGLDLSEVHETEDKSKENYIPAVQNSANQQPIMSQQAVVASNEFMPSNLLIMQLNQYRVHIQQQMQNQLQQTASLGRIIPPGTRLMTNDGIIGLVTAKNQISISFPQPLMQKLASYFHTQYRALNPQQRQKLYQFHQQYHHIYQQKLQEQAQNQDKHELTQPSQPQPQPQAQAPRSTLVTSVIPPPVLSQNLLQTVNTTNVVRAVGPSIAQSGPSQLSPLPPPYTRLPPPYPYPSSKTNPTSTMTSVSQNVINAKLALDKQKRSLLLQEQPLLLEELLEQEKREQKKQQSNGTEFPQAVVTTVPVPVPVPVQAPAPTTTTSSTLLSDQEFEQLRNDILDSGNESLRGPNDLFAVKNQSGPKTKPLIINSLPTPPLPPFNIVTEQDEQIQNQYEIWLYQQNNVLTQQLKCYEAEVQRFRKLRKPLTGKQRLCKKMGNQLSESEFAELQRLSTEQNCVQKHLDLCRKYTRQHALLIQDFRSKQELRQPQHLAQQQLDTRIPIQASQQAAPQLNQNLISLQSPINNSPIHSPKSISRSPLNIQTDESIANDTLTFQQPSMIPKIQQHAYQFQRQMFQKPVPQQQQQPQQQQPFTSPMHQQPSFTSPMMSPLSSQSPQSPMTPKSPLIQSPMSSQNAMNSPVHSSNQRRSDFFTSPQMQVSQPQQQISPQQRGFEERLPTIPSVGLRGGSPMWCFNQSNSDNKSPSNFGEKNNSQSDSANEKSQRATDLNDKSPVAPLLNRTIVIGGKKIIVKSSTDEDDDIILAKTLPFDCGESKSNSIHSPLVKNISLSSTVSGDNLDEISKSSKTTSLNSLEGTSSDLFSSSNTNDDYVNTLSPNRLVDNEVVHDEEEYSLFSSDVVDLNSTATNDSSEFVKKIHSSNELNESKQSSETQADSNFLYTSNECPTKIFEEDSADKQIELKISPDNSTSNTSESLTFFSADNNNQEAVQNFSVSQSYLQPQQNVLLKQLLQNNLTGTITTSSSTSTTTQGQESIQNNVSNSLHVPSLEAQLDRPISPSPTTSSLLEPLLSSTSSTLSTNNTLSGQSTQTVLSSNQKPVMSQQQFYLQQQQHLQHLQQKQLQQLQLQQQQMQQQQMQQQQMQQQQLHQQQLQQQQLLQLQLQRLQQQELQETKDFKPLEILNNVMLQQHSQASLTNDERNMLPQQMLQHQNLKNQNLDQQNETKKVKRRQYQQKRRLNQLQNFSREYHQHNKKRAKLGLKNDDEVNQTYDALNEGLALRLRESTTQTIGESLQGRNLINKIPFPEYSYSKMINVSSMDFGNFDFDDVIRKDELKRLQLSKNSGVSTPILPGTNINSATSVSSTTNSLTSSIIRNFVDNEESEESTTSASGLVVPKTNLLRPSSVSPTTSATNKNTTERGFYDFEFEILKFDSNFEDRSRLLNISPNSLVTQSSIYNQSDVEILVFVDESLYLSDTRVTSPVFFNRLLECDENGKFKDNQEVIIDDHCDEYEEDTDDLSFNKNQDCTHHLITEKILNDDEDENENENDEDILIMNIDNDNDNECDDDNHNIINNNIDHIENLNIKEDGGDNSVELSEEDFKPVFVTLTLSSELAEDILDLLSDLSNFLQISTPNDYKIEQSDNEDSDDIDDIHDIDDIDTDLLLSEQDTPFVDFDHLNNDIGYDNEFSDNNIANEDSNDSSVTELELIQQVLNGYVKFCTYCEQPIADNPVISKFSYQFSVNRFEFCSTECSTQFERVTDIGSGNDQFSILYFDQFNVVPPNDYSNNSLTVENQENQIKHELSYTNNKSMVFTLDDVQYKRWKPLMFRNNCNNRLKKCNNKEVLDMLYRMQITVGPDKNSQNQIIDDMRQCLFCHLIGDGVADGPGRLLNINVDQWVHLNCALWSEDVYETVNGALMNVETALKQSSTLSCTHCNQNGASVRCFKPRCTNVYHLSCAVKDNCVFYKNKTSYCSMHVLKNEKDNELTTLSVSRRVYVHRDENRQISSIMKSSTNNKYLLRVGSLIFLNVGQLLQNQLDNFHNENFIYPIGYKVIRFYWSMRRLNKRCRYICSIHDKEGRPEFRVCVKEDHEEDIEFIDSTPKLVWNKVLDQIMELRQNSDCACIQLFPQYIPGEDLFGLTEPVIVRILECLPGVDSLRDYKFKYGKNPFLVLPLAINPSGSARTEARTRPQNVFRRPHAHRTVSSSSSSSIRPIHQQQSLSMFSSTGSCTYTSSSFELHSPYTKQFVHSKSSQYKKMKQEWKNNVYLAPSKIQGLGLYASRDLEKHTMVIEYIGEIIRSEVAEIREKKYEAKNRGVYMFRLDEDRVIDATLIGGQARYINHSCNPNCVSEIVEIDKELRIILFAKRRISHHEELSYDYKFDIEDDQHKIPCNCGAINCRKWMN